VEGRFIPGACGNNCGSTSPAVAAANMEAFAQDQRMDARRRLTLNLRETASARSDRGRNSPLTNSGTADCDCFGEGFRTRDLGRRSKAKGG
jgi:hypothetical protein